MNRIPNSTDVVVIGGGPAGSTAANLLAQKGHDVVLFDQERHPRPTVGESVLPHCWKYFDELGASDDILAADFVAKAGGMTVWDGEIVKMQMCDFGFERPALHVERDEFDKILLDAAIRNGAGVYEEVKVREVEFDGDRASAVHYIDKVSGKPGRIETKFIVDASGQAAVIANQLKFREFDPDLRFMCVYGYFENSDYVGFDGQIYPFERRRDADRRPVTFVSGIGDWGWCWHIVQKELTSVGLVIPPNKAREFKSSSSVLEERFASYCEKVPVAAELLKDATLVPGSVTAIRDFAYYPKQLTGPGWFLAGDASAFVDPINSAGVVVAFYTGFLSSWAIAASLNNPAKEDRYRNKFDTLARQRLALFRISAIPAGHNSHPEDVELALTAAQFEKHSEQELLYVQTQLTHRTENLEPLLHLDDRLKYTDPARYYRVENIVGRDGIPLPLQPQRTATAV